MNGEVHQLASAMLVLAFTAVMLVVGLLYMERSARRPFFARKWHRRPCQRARRVVAPKSKNPPA
jgi:hypothetical protein